MTFESGQNSLVKIHADLGPLKSQMAETKSIIENVSQQSANALERGLIKSLKQSKNEFRSLQDSARSVLQDIAIQVAKTQIATPVASGIGSILSKITGGLLGKAGGGTIGGGVPTVVGERGPEIFVPRTAGSVLPNHTAQGASTPVHITQNINISAGVAGTVKQEIAAFMPTFKQIAVSAVAQDINKAGTIAKLTGQRS